jgi:hypothetical protein
MKRPIAHNNFPYPYYPIADRRELMKQFRSSRGYNCANLHTWMGKATGEYRPPKKGEWFISGAIPKCYRAVSDLFTEYYIAVPKRVHIETKKTIKEIA